MEGFIIKKFKLKEIIYELYSCSSLCIIFSRILSKGGPKKRARLVHQHILTVAGLKLSFCFQLNYWNQYTINIQFISMLDPIIFNRDKLNRGEKGK